MKVVQSAAERHPATEPVAVIQLNAPDTPPMNDPNTPEYAIGAVTVGVEVAVAYCTPPEVELTVPAPSEELVIPAEDIPPENVRRVEVAFEGNG